MKQRATASVAEPASSDVPVIVRIAGLPAAAMEPFGSPKCVAQARALQRLESDIESLRSRVVDRLHGEIGGAPPEVRRALLTIKRDCYNGRDLSSRRSSPAWSVFATTAPELAERLGELEDELAVARKGFEESFQRELHREVRHLATLIDDDNLRQGLALASPVVLSHLGRLRKPPASYKRRERRLVHSLLRYVSRTALKLSPFSTLTRLGLGTATDDPSLSPVRLRLGTVTQKELRRTKKHVVVKYFTLLRLYPPFRNQLEVRMNPTVEELSEGRYRFIAPFHWLLDRESRELRYAFERQVAVNLGGPMIGELQKLLRHGRAFAELVELLSRELESEPEVVEPVIEKLAKIGFLLVLFPWPTNDFDPESKLLAFLEKTPGDRLFREFARRFRRLLELREAAPAGIARLRGYREIDELRWAGFRLLTEALDLPEVKEAGADRQLNEDVFLLPGRGSESGAVADISQRSAIEALDSARPLLIYSDLRYVRYEFLHSLKAEAERHWPGHREVGFLDLFQAAQPLWREYVNAANAAVTQRDPELWNPFDLDEITNLKRLRDQVLEEMDAGMRLLGGEWVLDREIAERAVRRVPEVYVPAFGPCLFVQPADPHGDLWMLNHLLDGTGRFSNRYTAVMPDAMRKRFSVHLATGGHGVTVSGEPAEMIEIQSARDDHMNVHELQTERVLEMPGENPDLPPERRLGVLDVKVRLDGPLPSLVDREGRRLMPVFLGTNGLVGMPTLVRFLCQFGIAEFRLMHPPRPAETSAGITVFRRLRTGNLVVRRKMWQVSPLEALQGYLALPDSELFCAVDRWRQEHGIPDRVFVSEKLEVEFDRWPVHKPQYVDFTSPSFMTVLRAAIESSGETLKMEEVLPAPEAYPAAEDGRRWAFEAQLESIAFHRVRPWAAPLASKTPVSEPRRSVAELHGGTG